MKILHLLDERWDSGITAYALQIASLQAKAGYGVWFGVRAGKKPETLARQEGHVRTVSINNFFDLRAFLSTEEMDVVNVHTGSTHTWAMLCRLLSGAQKKFILVRTRGDARPLKTNFLTRFVYGQTQAVIAASDHIRTQYLAELGWGGDRVKTIFPSVKADLVIQPAPSHVVGMLGRLDPVKGHSVFLEAIRFVLNEKPTTRFLIAGKEANISIQLLKNQAHQLGIGTSLEFVGFVPSSQDFMRGCSVGVISSIGSEEVSRACLEWMSVGRPVVGTLVGCLPELIETNETGFLVSPQDSRALADGILTCLKNEAVAAQMGQKGWLAAKEKFSPETFLSDTLLLYQKASGV